MPSRQICSAFLLGCALAIANFDLADSRALIDTVLPLSEIIWRPEGTAEFVGSPSIVALPNGSYLASHVSSAACQCLTSTQFACLQ